MCGREREREREKINKHKHMGFWAMKQDWFEVRVDNSEKIA